MHAFQLNLHEPMNKKVIVTSDHRNKNLDDEIKTKRRPIIASAITSRLLKTKTGKTQDSLIFNEIK